MTRKEMTRGRWRSRAAMTTVVALCTVMATGTPALAGPPGLAPDPGAIPDGVALSAAGQDSAELAAVQGVTLERAVLEELDARAVTDFWVDFDDRADLSRTAEIDDWAERGQSVYDRLVETALASQAALTVGLTTLGVSHEPFWITNTVLVRGGDRSVLDGVLVRPEVAEIRADRTYELPEPVEGEAPDASLDEIAWGIADIGADRVWSDFGVRGGGIVVGNIDSGVEYTHPALRNQYRGNQGSFDHNYSWWDPSGVCPSAEPCDNNGHGTHTMGTMIGDDGAGNQVGTAPGARWIAAKGCEVDSCSDAAVLSSGQFMLAPTDLTGQNPRPDLRPHVVNNSWGEPNFEVESPFYNDIVDAWTAAGIFGVFSNGNEGDDRPAPGCDTTGSPADYEHAWSVGAYDANHALAAFSSRGPGGNGSVKPNIGAPGVAVRSSVPGGAYADFDGTSMAAPHQAGAVALIWSAAPALAGNITETRALLARTAVGEHSTACGGTPSNNNFWGEGRLDAFGAVSQAPRGPAGTLAGTVTETGSGGGLAGAIVTATGQDTLTTTTGPDGSYTLRLPVGSYTVTVEALGYTGQPAEGVEIVQDQTTTRDFTLDPVPVVTVAPDTLTSWQRPDETVGHPLTIGNRGAADLSWHVVDDGSACGTAGTPPWATVSPASGSVPPGGEQTIEVRFDSTGLADGELAADLCLAGDDPARPQVTVPLTLLVDQTLPGDWSQRDKLTPSVRTDHFDGFGWQVEVDGDTAVILACEAAPDSRSAAYVFARTDGVWREQAKLMPSVPLAGCSSGTFGFPGSIAIDGDTVLLGLPLNPEPPFVTGTFTVFTRTGDQWTEQAQFSSMGYGLEVAIDGDTAFTTSFDGESSFTYHVFQREGGEWSRQGEFALPEGLSLGGGPRPKIDVDGDTALLGTVQLADPPEGGTRAAIFSRQDGQWRFEAALAPSDGGLDLDFAEHEVSLDGDTAVVTASHSGNNEGRPLPPSAAYVYVRDAGGWHEQQKLLPAEPDHANWRAVAVDGDVIAVGAEDFGVHVWNRVGDRWRQRPTIVPAAPNADVPPPDCQPSVPCFITPGRFARSVGLDGDTLVASTYPLGLFGGGNGPAYVFDTGPAAPTLGLVPRAGRFGGVTVAEVSGSTTVTVENNGSADLRLDRLSQAGDHPGDFLLTDDFCSGRVVAPGRGCTFEVRFTPGIRSLGQRTARVDIPSNATTSPDSVPVTGEGLPAPPAIDVSPDLLTGQAPEGSRVSKPLLLSNRGTLDLAWSVFPDPAATEGLTLHPAGPATEVPAPPVDLGQADLARITTGGGAVVAGAATTPSAQVASPGTVRLSHSQSLDVRPDHTGRCANSDGSSVANQFLRAFTLPDFSLGSGLEITEVAFGIERLTAPVDLTVNVYVLRGDFTYDNLDRLATATVSLQPQPQTVVTVPVDAVAPAGSTLVMEVAAPTMLGTGAFAAGSNPDGESAPSYLAAVECGITEPTPYSRIDLPDTHLVMTMTGRVDCGSPWLGVNPGGGTVTGGDSQLAEVTLDAASLAPGEHTANLCLSSNDPSRQPSAVPVTLEVTEREHVTFDGLRDRVAAFEDGGEVTKAGAQRLQRTVDMAERHHDRGADGRAIQELEGFQRTAGDPRLVPSQDARDALIADAEQLIRQLADQLNDPGAAAPVTGQHMPI